MREVRITSYPRMHFSLIDLSEYGYREYGGVGLSVDVLPIRIITAPSEDINLDALINAGVPLAQVESLTQRLNDVKLRFELRESLVVMTVSGLVLHQGLGTGTRLTLSLLEALFVVNGCDVTPDTLKALSGRGAGSGLGLGLYFQGGVCLDIGRPKSGAAFRSSDKGDRTSVIPTIATRADMPDWPAFLARPKKARPISVQREQQYFETATPLSSEAVYEASYLALFGVLGAAISADREAFSSALNRLQILPWKAGEIALHGEVISSAIRELRGAGAEAVAMSSFGPHLLCVGDMDKERQKHLRLEFDFYPCKFRNIGREIEVV